MTISVHNQRSILARATRALVLFGLVALSPTALHAQYIGAAPPPPPPPAAGTVETPAASLARNIRLITLNPRNFDALVAAGRGALDLGDLQAAVGFFSRAEEVRPGDPAPKIGLGGATVEMGDANTALDWFAQAERLGASRIELGNDRGLARDLLGQQALAQADYNVALLGRDRDEARRRLALSLAISRDTAKALMTLQPLLNLRDPAAQRVRAFILALGGDRDGARRAIDSAMPGASARIDPFFAILPSLSPAQKAAAVHLGVFPTPGEMRLATAQPQRAPSPTIQRNPVVVSAPPFVQRPPRTAPPPVARPLPMPPLSATTATTTAATGTTVVATAPVTAAPTPATPGFSLPPSFGERSSASGDRLSGIDRLLAQADVPPAPQPLIVDTGGDGKKGSARKAAAAKRLAETKKLADSKKLADAAKAAEAKQAAEERREREKLGVAGTYWVQLAGGSHADRMGSEFRRFAAKSSALRRRGGYVTQGKDYYRLLTGPFDSKDDAQDFTNALAKDHIDGFSWTRTPATIKIEKITPK